jgi:3-isopropylmalate dehydrogenase
VHGSAPDIAGQNVANPIAAILSGALLLDEVGEPAAATAVRQAVNATLANGLRPADLTGPDGTASSTTDLGRHVADHIAAPSSTTAVSS